MCRRWRCPWPDLSCAFLRLLPDCKVFAYSIHSMKEGKNMKAIEKVKGFVQKNRYAFAMSAMSAIMMCSAGAVDGATTSFDLSTTMTSAVQQIVNDLLKMIAAVLPITVTLLGAAIGVSYGIRFIKRITSKSS